MFLVRGILIACFCLLAVQPVLGQDAESDYRQAKASYQKLLDSRQKQLYRENWLRVRNQFVAVKEKYPRHPRAAKRPWLLCLWRRFWWEGSFPGLPPLIPMAWNGHSPRLALKRCRVVGKGCTAVWQGCSSGWPFSRTMVSVWMNRVRKLLKKKPGHRLMPVRR